MQFDALFTDDLYFKIGEHAIKMAESLKKMFKDQGYEFFIDSPTNQQFILLSDEQYENIKKHVAVSFWEKPDSTHTVVRFATGWSTSEEELSFLGQYL